MGNKRSTIGCIVAPSIVTACLLGLVLIPSSAMAIVLDDAEFVPFSCDGEPMTDGTSDPHTDHRDLVGSIEYPAALRAVTDTHLYLRIRLNADPRQSTAGIGDLRPFGWGFLFDVAPFNYTPEGLYTSYDYLLHLNGTGSPDTMRLVANDADTQTALDDPTASANGEVVFSLSHGAPEPVWHVALAPGTTPDSQGNPDYHLTMIVPWSDLALAGIDRTTAVRVWAGSTNSNNAINRDFVCFGGGIGARLDETGSDPVILDPDEVMEMPDLTITEPGAGATYEESPTTISGTADPGLTIVVTLNGEVVGQTTADEDGNWSIDLDEELAPGNYTVVVMGTDEAGNTTRVEQDFAVDPSTAVAITMPADGRTVRTSSPTVSGTGEPGQDVVIFVDGVEAATVVVDENGDWTWTPDEPIADGPVTVRAESTSEAGVTTADEVSFVIDTTGAPQVVTIDNEDGATLDPRPTLTGTAAPGSEVEIVIDGEVVDTVTADVNGNWTWTPTEDLPDGEHVIVARPEGGTDADGDSVVIVVGTSSPVLTVDRPTAGETLEPGTTMVSGTSEPGATIEIYVDGVLVGTTEADDNGDWTQEVVIEGEGDHSIEVRARDDAGRESSVTITVTVSGDDAPVSEFRITGGGPACASAATGSSVPSSTLAVLGLAILGLALRRRRG